MRVTTAAIVVRDSRVLLAHRKPGGAIGGKWEFPGGKVRPDESPRAALIRELAEELQTEAAVGSRLGSVEFSNNDVSYTLVAFEARIDAIGNTPMHDELRWIATEELSTFDLADSDRTLAEHLGLL